MNIKKKKKNGRKILRISLEDVKQIDGEFLDEMENVKRRLGNVKDVEIITAFQEVLLGAYNSAIEIRTLEREVDYDIKFAEIKERRRNLKPWRRCWLWRLLFQPITNRAQDIIEKRAELNADIEHTAAEAEIEDERKKLPADTEKEPSERKTKQRLRKLRKELKEAIKRADEAETSEMLTEPQAVAEPAQEPRTTQTHRPRTPTCCRKPRN